jgi:hypothetical protein
MAKEKEKQWKIPSNTKPDEKHVVTEYDDGTFKCSCEYNIYAQLDCAHIKRAKLYKIHPELEGETLEIVPAKTSEVKVVGNQVWVPIIPLPIQENILITIMYDLLELGFDITTVKKYYKGCGIAKLTVAKIYEFVEQRGRSKAKSLTPLTAFIF